MKGSAHARGSIWGCQVALAWALCLGVQASTPLRNAPPALPEGARCVAPAKPGGGFDLTCQWVRDLLMLSDPSRLPVAIHYQPGGIGALAFRAAVQPGAAPADGRSVIAFSSGTLLNLAQGRFGAHGPQDVRWLAAMGVDYGVVAVRRNSPYQGLAHLMQALREQPGKVVFGGAGSIGSQDWMKAALLARAAGVSHKAMRFVAFEGGGEALQALRGDHVQVLAGDAAEVGRQMEQGAEIRVLAVLSATRLPGRWRTVPTAAEQGVDVRWPIVRGLYMEPRASEQDVQAWREALARAVQHAQAREQGGRFGLELQWVSGAALEQLVREQWAEYRALALAFGLVR